MAKFITRNTVVTNPNAHPEEGPAPVLFQDGHHDGDKVWARFNRRNPGDPFGTFETTDADTISRLRDTVSRGDLDGYQILEVED